MQDAGVAAGVNLFIPGPQSTDAEALAGLREKQGLGQQELARAVGISPAYLAMIEAGERQPDDAIRRALARVLQVPGWEALP